MTEIVSDTRSARWNANRWIRQIHRWLSIAFTLTVIAAFIVLAQAEPLVWVSYIPLLPLFLPLAAGLYMFALPVRWRGGREA